MPIVRRQIKEQHKSIIRPVVIDVVNDLIRFMELKPNTDIIFNGYSEIALLPNGIIGIRTDNQSKENIRTIGRNRIFVSIEDDEPETTLLEMPVTYPEQDFIFADQDLGTFVRPIKKRSGIRLNFNNRFTSRAAADQWLSNMEELMAQMVKDYVHEVKYNYAYPDEVIGLMHTLWKYREYQGGYDETFSKWFRDHSTKRLTAIANQNGSQTDLVIGETMDNVVGNWDFERPPYPTKANQLGSWQAEFSYRFEFDKAIGMVVQYPIMIHNQLLDATMIPKRRLPSYRGKVYQKPEQQTRFEGIQQDLGVEFDPRLTKWLISPDYDEWQLPVFDYKFVPQYQVLLQLDPNDLRDVLDIREMGDYAFTDRTLMYMKHIRQGMFAHRRSVIQMVLFEDDQMLSPECLVFDPLTLKIRSTYDLDIRKQYRMVIYIDADFRRLWEEVVSDLKERGVWGQEVISVVYPNKVPPIDEEGRISDKDWQDFIDAIDWSNLPVTSTLYTGQFILIARNKQDAHR